MITSKYEMYSNFGDLGGSDLSFSTTCFDD